MNPPTPSDAELVQQALAGDDGAFRQLVVRYQGLVYACARAITRHDADAADAAQEAFIRLHRHLAQVDPRRPLKPYLATIAANCARTLVARRGRWPELPDAAEWLETLPDPAAGAPQRLAEGERRVAIHDLIGRLPQTLREVCTLFYLGGCNCQQVAASLEMSETAVKVALHRARQRLLAQGIGEWRNAL
jgi:RNA polymerase sigma-70 factor (ECF subfamily)